MHDFQLESDVALILTNELPGAGPPSRDCRQAQLDPAEAERRDVVDGAGVVAAPGNGGVGQANLRARDPGSLGPAGGPACCADPTRQNLPAFYGELARTHE